ncbi:MAG: ribosome recycling factor [Thermoleophilaceae bacterium]|nr:ribosome recycling factor [Thermoleophilaceae bacterium]
MMEDLLKDATERMQKSVEATRTEFGTVRTGRASPQLLDRVEVDYYGAKTPLKQLANISASEARLLTVTPYDKGSIGAIEKAIIESEIGLTPSNDGALIRLSIPELTEERRKELAKILHGIAEEGRVAIRNIRRDVMHDLRELKKEGEVGSDDEHRAEAELQKLTDARIGEIDSSLQGKETEILEV